MNIFNENFDKFACIGESISAEYQGIELTARIVFDSDYKIDDDDFHNPDQSVTGCNDEQFAKLLEARQAWFDDDWFYCGIVISASKNGVELTDHAASLWGIECNYPDSDNDYLRDVCNQLADEAIEEANNALDDMRVKLCA